jgi:hypothetical protein
MASHIIALLLSRSCDFCLKFLIPIIFRSSSSESSHLTAGLWTCSVPCGLWNVSFLHGSCSCILQMCLNHFNLPSLMTFTISGTVVCDLLILWYLPNRTLTLYFQANSICELQKELCEQGMRLAQEMDHIHQEQMKEAKLRWL